MDLVVEGLVLTLVRAVRSFKGQWRVEQRSMTGGVKINDGGSKDQ